MNSLEVKSIPRTYDGGEATVHALRNVSFPVPKGEFVAIVGESGSGKGIFLNMIGALSTLTSRSVLIDGRDILSLDDNRLTIFRRRSIGFISQGFNLTPEPNMEQSILLPALLNYQRSDRSHLEEPLLVLNLMERHHHFPSQLSSRQQQRIAIGRALMIRPTLVLADEPAGNLDAQDSREVIAPSKKVAKKYEQTVIVTTHSRSIAQSADWVFQVSDGVLTDFGGYRGRRVISVLFPYPYMFTDGKTAWHFYASSLPCFR